MLCDRDSAASSSTAHPGPPCLTSESSPLLQPWSRSSSVTGQSAQDIENVNSKQVIGDSKRQLGVLSTISLIFNRVIGGGVFVVPSIILTSSGSVGMTFVMWILGVLVAAAGTMVYVELGTGLPRSGGEKVYMEYIYRRPAYMTTCVYATYCLLIGRIPATSVAFGEYALHALAFEQTPTNVRIVAFLCSTFCVIVHGAFLNFGLRLQNTLGAFKLVVLILIVGSGFLSLIGAPGFAVGKEYDQPNNYTWQTFWEGSNLGANAFVIGMYNVIWCYTGYSNANYVLSEVRDPIKTMKLAAPLATCIVAFVYISTNVAYFAVVSKADMLNGGTIPAALFFRNLYGPETDRALSAVIALSSLGNILAVLFAQGRVVQELGREGVLPWSLFFASNKPFNTPLPGLFTQYVISVLLMAFSPPGDAYLFMVNREYARVFCHTHLPYSTFLSPEGCYFCIRMHSGPISGTHHSGRYKFAVIFFFLSNIFLVVVPMVPPSAGYEPYEHLPYYSHVVMALFVGLLGVLYWFIFFWWMPQRNGYTLKRVTVVQDGVPRNIFRRVPSEMMLDRPHS